MDAGMKEVDAALAELEKRVHEVYAEAYRDIQDKTEDYFRRFRIKDQIKLKDLNAGKITEDEYRTWRRNQLLVGDRWREMSEVIAQDLANANQIAASMANEFRYDAYAMGHNYGAFSVEAMAGSDIGVSYTLYDRRTVERLIRDEPQLLPNLPPEKMLDIPKDKIWNKQKMTSQLTQGILQGESVPELARRLRSVTDMDEVASLRNARTMANGAQNAGRVDSYKAAQGMGIKLSQQWLATLDGRTRHNHRQIDGEVVEIGKEFSNGCKFPGDPDGRPHEVYNCRCTLIPVIPGISAAVDDLKVRNHDHLDGMSYEEWKAGKQTKATKQTPTQKQTETKKAETPKTPEREKLFTWSEPKTREDLEQLSAQFCKDTWKMKNYTGTDFTGVDVETAGRVVKRCGEFYDEFDVPMFNGIMAPAGNTKAGKQIGGAQAAFNSATRQVYLNRKTFASAATIDKALAEDRKAYLDLVAHPERYKIAGALERILKASEKSGRATVPTTLEQVIDHELGHAITRKIKDMGEYDKVYARMNTYASGISGYACESFSEYIAESFCSWRMGETVADPMLIKLFERARR